MDIPYSRRKRLVDKKYVQDRSQANVQKNIGFNARPRKNR